MKRYTVQLRGTDGDQWQDVLYTNDHDRAARFVQGMVESNPQVKDGRVVDVTQGQRRGETARDTRRAILSDFRAT